MKTREFVKISPTFWTGPTGRQLRKAGAEVQLVALYLMSSPHTNYSGLFQLPLNYICNDTGLSRESVRKALSAIESVGFARYDENSECLWVVNGARWQIGELKSADKRVTGLQKEFDALPEDCPFKVEFLAKHGKALCLSSKAAKPAHAPKQAELVPTPAPAPTKAPAPVQQAAAPNEERFFELLQELLTLREDTGVSTPAGDAEVRKRWLAAAARAGYVDAGAALYVSIQESALGSGTIEKYLTDLI